MSVVMQIIESWEYQILKALDFLGTAIIKEFWVDKMQYMVYYDIS